MKKLILSLLACGTIATAANAQAGSWLLFGQAGVSANSYDGAAGPGSPANATNWYATPGLGYQFDNHWTLGLFGEYGYTGTKATGTGQPRLGSNGWQAGVFVRYTENLNKIFSVFGQFNGGFTHGNMTTDGKVNTNSRYNGFDLNFTPFIAVNVHKGLALNFAIGGIGYMNKAYENVNNSNGSFNLSFGQQFSWGISKNFGGHTRRIHREPGSDRHMKNWRDDEGESPRKSRKSSDDE